MDEPNESSRVIEHAARTSYGRLVAFLARRTRDIAAAEDALADAFAAALRTWPTSGVPERPEAWLLAAAGNRLLDQQRRADTARRHGPDLASATAPREPDPMESAATSLLGMPDERLHMLFACAHPAIDAAMHTPLMLQAVLGLEANKIAAAFIVSPTAMAQRLVRAKGKIRDAGISFDLPPREQLGERLDAVLDAIYAAFGSGWDDVAGADAASRGLADEAVFLGRMLVDLMPDQPEPLGLLALMLYCQARRAARAAGTGFTPLDQQDASRWSRPLLAEAESLLRRASEQRQFGRFQIEAAIQSAHVDGALRGQTDWPAIVRLYDGLLAIAPTLGAAVGRAAAIAEAQGPSAGLSALDAIDAHASLHADMATYQPAWALRAHLLAMLGASDAAARAYERAIGLCEDDSVRRFLLGRLAAVQSTS
ncbi:MAG: DUF6596 domain-containing protein [Planctomycetota bacterium]|nr:DUF6596 domain-containing protein [Planctomycetota bacterium]